MTSMTRISPKVKEAVAIRDRETCVLCGGRGFPNAHVVRRSQGGMGIEKNIVCLCYKCHKEFDEGTREQKERAYVRIVAHLKGFYPDWSKGDMIYKKGDI